MSQQLNEGNFITDFVKKVFDAILADRNKALERALQNDPEFKRIIANVEKSKAELEQLVARRIAKNPALKKKLAMVRSL